MKYKTMDKKIMEALKENKGFMTSKEISDKTGVPCIMVKATINTLSICGKCEIVDGKIKAI